MSRNTDAAVTSASQLVDQRYRLLFSVDSLSTPYYACTGDRFIYCMGNTYSPIGHLGGIDPVQEDSDPFPRSVRVWVSVQNSAAMHAALNESLFRKKITIWSAMLNSAGTMVGTPQVEFKGRANTSQINFKDEERGDFLEVEFETRLKQAPIGANMTKDFLVKFLSSSGDTLFDHIHLIPQFQPNWGGATALIRPPGTYPRSPGVPSGEG